MEESASWKEPVTGRRCAYSGVPWINALSRWMCGWVNEGSSRGNCAESLEGDWCGVTDDMVPCGESGE